MASHADMQKGKSHYRSDIDGLRAIAVLAVIANHLPAEYLPSGFLGVDVFFVISGFVVTAATLRLGGPSFSGFYSTFLARRVKRLAPALIVSVAVTSIAVLAFDTQPGNSLKTGFAALFGLANIALYQFGLDYFSPSSKFNAFTHMWSLGVEEQFYVLYPLLLWLTVLKKQSGATRNLAITLVVITVVSLLFFLGLYRDHQNAAYYLVPFRFWELGLGALAYLLTQRAGYARYSRIFSLLAPVCLALLFVSFLLPQHYAAANTAFAVAATALLLLSPGNSATGRLLAVRPAAYVGKISYSLYLWHWPIVALGPLALHPDLRTTWVYLPVMTICAVLSYHFIEDPLRRREWAPNKLREIAYGFGVSGVLVILLVLSHRFALISPDKEQAQIFPAGHLAVYPSGLPFDVCAVDETRPLQDNTYDLCTIAPKAGVDLPRVWAMGDSHIAHLQALIYELHHRIGMGVHLIATPGRPFPSIWGDEYAPRKIIFDRVMADAKPGDILLISRLAFARGYWPPKLAPGYSKWAREIGAMAETLQAKGISIVVVSPPPIFNFDDVRECRLSVREYCGEPREKILKSNYLAIYTLGLLLTNVENVHLFHPFNTLCPPDQAYCYPDDGERFLFRDKDHLNTEGAKRLTDPLLEFLTTENLLPDPG